MSDDPVFIKGPDLWVPAGDKQLIEGLGTFVKPYKRPMVDGRVAWRYDRLEAALEFVHPDRRRICIDVGAHVGLWTRWMAYHFACTHAFEPVLRHFECLIKNLISDYGQVELHMSALGDYEGSMGVHIEWEVSGRSYMDVDGAGTIVNELDNFNFEEVDFIKIDVEGYERKVLIGAEFTIKNNRPIIVIEQLGHEERYGEKRNSALALLKDWGMVELRPNMKGDFYMGWKNG